MLRALAAAVVLLLLGGCGLAEDAAPERSDPSRTAVEPLVATPCDPGEQGESGRCEPCEDYEGCFDDPADMEYFYGQVIDLVQDFADEAVPDLEEPAEWWYVPEGASGKEGCTDEDGARASYTDESYEYCPFDRSVYVGERQMWDFYERLGDAAPAVGIAHEWGHHLQSEAGVVVTSRDDVIASENQADCAAGAWSAWLVEQEVMTDDDFDDVGALLVEIASEEGPDRDHGTVEEREDGFVRGFDGGLEACSDYFPDRPLV